MEIRHGFYPKVSIRFGLQQRIRLVHGEYMPTHAYLGEPVPQGAPHRFRNCPRLTIHVTRVSGILSWPMKKELSLKKALAVRCPTCGAAPGEKCELSTGQPRTDPHRDRRSIAKIRT